LGFKSLDQRPYFRVVIVGSLGLLRFLGNFLSQSSKLVSQQISLTFLFFKTPFHLCHNYVKRLLQITLNRKLFLFLFLENQQLIVKTVYLLLNVVGNNLNYLPLSFIPFRCDFFFFLDHCLNFYTCGLLDRYLLGDQSYQHFYFIDLVAERLPFLVEGLVLFQKIFSLNLLIFHSKILV